jgi:hypothetical protein
VKNLTFKQCIKDNLIYSDSEDDIENDIINEIKNDKNFPESGNYDIIYFYLKKYNIPDNAIRAFSKLFNMYLDYKDYKLNNPF